MQVEVVNELSYCIGLSKIFQHKVWMQEQKLIWRVEELKLKAKAPQLHLVPTIRIDEPACLWESLFLRYKVEKRAVYMRWGCTEAACLQSRKESGLHYRMHWGVAGLNCALWCIFTGQCVAKLDCCVFQRCNTNIAMQCNDTAGLISQ